MAIFIFSVSLTDNGLDQLMRPHDFTDTKKMRDLAQLGRKCFKKMAWVQVLFINYGRKIFVKLNILRQTCLVTTI